MIIGRGKVQTSVVARGYHLQQIEAKIKKGPTVDNRVLQGLFSPDLGRCSSTRGCDYHAFSVSYIKYFSMNRLFHYIYISSTQYL